MNLNKYFFVLYLIVITVVSVFSQTYFEGKITQESVYTSKSANNLIMNFYYKNNKVRTDYDLLTGASQFTSISIVDLDKRERVMLMNMPKLKSKSATLSDVDLIERPNERIEKFEDYKTIFNHKCQKIVLTSTINGKETKVTGYADLNYLLKTLVDFNGKTIDYPLFFESETVTPTMGTIITTVLNITEETLDEDIFNTSIPSDYSLIDTRKKKGQTIVSSNNVLNSSLNNGKTEDYSQFTNSELDSKLQAALKIEDFDTAAKLKEVIEKRSGPILKYKSKSLLELQDLLKIAVSKEEFETANLIQEEIKKRSN